MTDPNQRPFTAASFNQYLKEKKLMAAQCSQCGALSMPPRAICMQCYSDRMSWVEMNGRASLAAYTAIYIGPTFMCERGFDRSNPYLTGIVQLDEGVKISARLLGFDEKQPETVQVGAPLSVEFLEIGAGEELQVQLAFRAV
ncbi:MAG: Zn-ribbon domain-containing OB-fold protein [Anaerolineales bacterium]|nr:Zn-ribbon domain-containing OB-fold protein [Anaerolineales bacterium]